MVLDTMKKTLAGVAALGALALGGAALAGAAGDGDGATRDGSTSRPHEEALTGDTATKVKEAALAEVPGGTVLRVETDAGGVYEAHVRKADGTEVEVNVNKAFEVTAVEAQRGRGGHGHHGPGDRGNEEALTGTTATRVREAALERLPGGTVLRVETDEGGIYEAHVRKADGTEVEVKVNKAFDVTAVESHGRR